MESKKNVVNWLWRERSFGDARPADDGPDAGLRIWGDLMEAQIRDLSFPQRGYL
jgi:hypothetical protein